MSNKFAKNGLLLGLGLLLLVGCGKEVGRVPFSAEATASAPLQLAAGDVAFWTDLDIAYDGDASLEYRIDLLQGGASAATAVCDPLGQMNIKLGWVETHLGASSSRRGSGKMTCGATLAKAGPTIVQATLAFGVRPTAFALERADLVVKQ